MRQVTYCHSSRRGRAAPRASSEGLLALRFWPTGRRLGRGAALPLVRTDPARRPDPGRCRTSHRTQPQDHRPMDRRRPRRGLVATWERQAPARGYRGGDPPRRGAPLRVARVGDPAGDLAAAAGPRLTMESFGFGWQSGSLIPSPVQQQHPWGLVGAGNAVRPRHFSPRAAGARSSPPHT